MLSIPGLLLPTGVLGSLATIGLASLLTDTLFFFFFGGVVVVGFLALAAAAGLVAAALDFLGAILRERGRVVMLAEGR